MWVALVMTILAGMILASIVMLSLNYYFYMRRRLTDVRLEAIHEVNWLLAQFPTNCTAERDYVPSENFLQSFRAATAKTRALFSGTTCQIFRRIEAMARQPSSMPGGKTTMRTFIGPHDSLSSEWWTYRPTRHVEPSCTGIFRPSSVSVPCPS